MGKFIFNETHGILLKLIAENHTIKTIAKIKRCSVSNIHKRLKVLAKYNYLKIDKNFKGQTNIYELTSKGSNALEKFLGLSRSVHTIQKLKSTKNIIRLHNISIKFPIKLKPIQWTKLTQKLIKMNIISEQKTTQMTNWSQTFFSTTEVQIRTTPKSIIIRLPGDYYANTPLEAKNKMLDDLYTSILPKLENWLKIKLDKPNKITTEIITEHNAIANNEIAKQCIEAGLKLEIRDNNGELRWIVDDSERKDRWGNTIKLKELEAPHRIKSEEDVEKVKELISDITYDNKWNKIKHKINNYDNSFQLMNDNLVGINKSMKLLHNTFMEQTKQTNLTNKIYAKGMQEHMTLIRGLQDATKKLAENAIEMKTMMAGVEDIIKGVKHIFIKNKAIKRKRKKKIQHKKIKRKYKRKIKKRKKYNYKKKH